jgi:hypothetical protein
VHILENLKLDDLVGKSLFVAPLRWPSLCR